jgi:hypothetical protein
LIAGLAASGPVCSEVIFEQSNAANLYVKVNDDKWQPTEGAWDNGLIIPAVKVLDARITIDGKATEYNWKKAPEITVPMYYGGVNVAYVQALYTGEDTYIKVRWQDDTEDREYHPWVWDKNSKSFVPGPQVEDSLMLSWEAHCEWTPSFLSGYGFDFDGWHWMAARTDPVGQALDVEGNVKVGRMMDAPYSMYVSRNTERAWNVKFMEYGVSGEGDLHAPWYELQRTYFWLPADEAGLAAYRAWPDGNILRPNTKFVQQLPAPKPTYYNKIRTHTQYQPLHVEGDAGEVDARGHWENGYWTVEFKRAMVTAIGGQDDTTFLRLTQFSIHIYDHTVEIDQGAESKRLFLQFME